MRFSKTAFNRYPNQKNEQKQFDTKHMTPEQIKTIRQLQAKHAEKVKEMNREPDRD